MTPAEVTRMTDAEEHLAAITAIAQEYLDELADLTTEQFERGLDQPTRKKLQQALNASAETVASDAALILAAYPTVAVARVLYRHVQKFRCDFGY